MIAYHWLKDPEPEPKVIHDFGLHPKERRKVGNFDPDNKHRNKLKRRQARINRILRDLNREREKHPRLTRFEKCLFAAIGIITFGLIVRAIQMWPEWMELLRGMR